MNKLYKVERKRHGSKDTRIYYMYHISEYSLPDSLGRWQRVRVVCTFPNRGYQDAKTICNFLQAGA